MMNGFGDAAQIKALQDEIATKCGVKVRYNRADVSKPADCAAMVAAAQEELGGLDILVNNAGVQFVADIADFPAEQWDRIIAINLSSVFHATKAAIPAMKAKGWGRIINIASAHGLVASGQKAAYVAPKHGVVGLTKVAAIELANAGVTCNAICPGWVLTPLVQQQLEARAKKDRHQRRGGEAAVPGGEAADGEIHDAGDDRRDGGVPVLGCRRRRSQAQRFQWTAGWVAQ